MTNRGVNWGHPELQNDEIFLGNFDLSAYKRMAWATKRIGEIAYDIHNRPIQGMYPVFVKAKEFDKWWNH